MAVQRDKAAPESSQRRPRHIAVIMDGNGRWAELRSKPRHSGHRAGVAAVKTIVEAAAREEIDYLTLFAFSSENWRRPGEEVSRLMGLFFDVLQREIESLHHNNVRLKFIGKLDLLADGLVSRIRTAEAQTEANSGLKLQVAVAYGGRWDITNAMRQVAERIGRGEITAQDVDEQAVAGYLSLGEAPDPDLLIRTGGEHRISNFLLWHLAYTELYFCDCLWPDFDADEFADALEFFAERQRRFGRTPKQLGVG